MPKTPGFSYLLVFVDTFTGWTEVFPTRTQRSTREQALLKEIVPRFGLPQSLQRSNGPSFIAMISQEPGHRLRDQIPPPLILVASSLKERRERPTRLLKRGSGQTMSRNTYKWIHMLPIALMRLQEAPKRPLLLSPYEIWASILNLLFLDINALLKHIIDLGRFQQELPMITEQILPRPQEDLKNLSRARGPSINAKTWQEKGSPKLAV